MADLNVNSIASATGTSAATGVTPGTNDSSTALATTAFVKSQNYQASLGFTPVQQGGGVGQGNNKVYFGWTASNLLKATVDSTDLGAVAMAGRDNTFSAANIFSNPPTITTAPTSTDNSSKVPTTNWVLNSLLNDLTYGMGTRSYNIPGYQRLAGGLLFQWGRATFTSTDGISFTSTTYYPVAFPVVCLTTMISGVVGGDLDQRLIGQFVIYNLANSFFVAGARNLVTAQGTTFTVCYFTIGY